MRKKRNNTTRVVLSIFYVLLISLLVVILLYSLFIKGESGLKTTLAWIGIGLIMLFDVLLFSFLASISRKRKKRKSRRKRIKTVYCDIKPAAPAADKVYFEEKPSSPAAYEAYSDRKPAIPDVPVGNHATMPYTEKSISHPAPKKPAAKPKKAAPKKSPGGKVQIDLNIRPHEETDFKIMRNIITTASSIILGTRKEQQDALYVSDTTFFAGEENADAFAVVCDGMGGLANGSKASKTAAAILSGLYKNSRPIANADTFYRNAIARAQSEVGALSASGSGGQRAGTTLVSAIIQNDKLYTASVGDSRIYIVRNGQIKMLTRDHNYYLLLKEQLKNGQITEEQLNSATQKEALISYIGMPELKIIDIMSSPLQLVDGDVILLCSDGLTKALTKEEICDIIFENADKLQDCAGMLTAAAQRKKPKGLDNTSVILLKYN